MKTVLLFLAFGAVAFGFQCGSGRLIWNPLSNQWDCAASATGGTGTVTSVGLAGTANQITVTGSSPITTSGSWTLSLATASLRRVCSIVVGADDGSALTDANIGPQGQQCKIPYAATVVEIDVNADTGTPSVIVRKKHCATFAGGVCTSWTSTDLLSGALSAAASNFDACSNTGGTTGIDGGTTCSGTLQNTSLAAGDWLELKSGTAGGAAKRLSIDIIYTVN